MTYTEEQYNDVLRSTAAEMQALIAAHADAVKELEAKHAAQLATLETTHAEALAAKDAEHAAALAVAADELAKLQQALTDTVASKDTEITVLQASLDEVTKGLATAASEITARDTLIAELEGKVLTRDEILDGIRADLNQAKTDLAASQAETQGVYQFRDNLLVELEATGGDPEKVAAVAQKALGTLADKRKAEALAKLEELKAEVAAREAELAKE